MCDAINFLANGDRLAYYGPTEEAKQYFQQPDLAEIYNLLEPTDKALGTTLVILGVITAIILKRKDRQA